MVGLRGGDQGHGGEVWKDKEGEGGDEWGHQREGEWD
jgi:hypothetical protein